MRTDRKLLTAAELVWMLKINLSHLWRLRDNGAHPAPLRLGNGCCLRWDSNTNAKWIADST